MSTPDRAPKCTPIARRAPLALALAAAAAFSAGSAHADIDAAPSSIVDHGTYITDTVAHRDWYKFSNAVNTIGSSFEAAMAAFVPLGWASASIGQVRGLQSRFGWTADTPSFSFNPNYGLTYAMADAVGLTSTFYVDTADGGDLFKSIQAVVSNAFYSDYPGDSGHFVTSVQTERLSTLREGDIYFGDYVVGDDDVLANGTSNSLYGVWLTRDSSAAVSPVPEPGAWGLMSLGLVGLFMRRRAVS